MPKTFWKRKSKKRPYGHERYQNLPKDKNKGWLSTENIILNSGKTLGDNLEI